MPHRRAELRELCSECRGVTAGDHCERCGRHLCTQHVPLAGHLCGNCEAAFERSVDAADRIGTWAWFLLPANLLSTLIGALLVLFFGLRLPRDGQEWFYAGLMGMWWVTPWALFVCKKLWMMIARRRFLRERSDRGRSWSR